MSYLNGREKTTPERMKYLLQSSNRDVLWILLNCWWYCSVDIVDILHETDKVPFRFFYH
jgi:hypothetical protein